MEESVKIGVEHLNRECHITIIRKYGPYLDNRPVLPRGRYLAKIDSVSTILSKVNIYTVSYGGFKYIVDAKDADDMELV